ncbi:MAG: DUF1345 domain-containing protein [Solirubrobacterales bacterium]|nr:DUF1345 domain-containing protein [Solirubrobacterales bacterium]
MAAAVLVIMVMTIALPQDISRPWPNWVLPVLEGLLLVMLIMADPGRISKRSTFLKWGTLSLVALLVLDTLLSTVLLVDQLINAGPVTQSAGRLLAVGAVVWLGNVIAFSLAYWSLDGGGSVNRALNPDRSRDFAFPQELSPEVGSDSWMPKYVDYLYLGYTNATAFSPTDAMPLTPPAKSAMTVQSLISLVVLGLVIARAVNIFN